MTVSGSHRASDIYYMNENFMMYSYDAYKSHGWQFYYFEASQEPKEVFVSSSDVMPMTSLRGRKYLLHWPFGKGQREASGGMKHTGMRPTVDKHTDLHHYKKDALIFSHPIKPNLRGPQEGELGDVGTSHQKGAGGTRASKGVGKSSVKRLTLGDKRDKNSSNSVLTRK
ncbi:uncharacterized protein LOC144289667 [Canis aureus]